ncbi:MAG TPA: chromate resistance protein ChrB domain-containing protein [Gemmatimonadales bacterium]|nr:chromate resistance protein ChrB domain-containing protein [Gemmatimonadales bacterium]
MNDSHEPFAQARWLLLIHQLPPKPDYLRVKMRRRLSRMGAALLKSTVYVLPNGSEALEDFTWLAREIHEAGGSAMVCEARFVEGVSDEEIEAMLDAETIESSAADDRDTPERIAPGRTWVTRKGVFVDRIASAWLIRRFIDPEARFKFVPARGYRPEPGELRFDMFDAEYTHEGERCTFQTLVARFGLRDRALAAVGEIVHDIDCKDEQFGRAETQGVARLLRGIADGTEQDEERLERGGRLFEDLYAAFSHRAG